MKPNMRTVLRLIPVSIVLLILLYTAVHSHREFAAVQKTAEDIIEKNSLLEADVDFRGCVHLDLPGLNGDTYLFFDDDYAYYTDSEGFIERIDSHDLEKPHPESVTENFSPERLNEEAIRLFDSVFFVQERKLGSKHLLDVSCGKADFIVHQGIACWDVSVTATYAKTSFLQEPVTDPGSIRINAETGEYIWFASTFK